MAATHESETVQVSVPVPTALQRRMKAYAASQGILIKDFIREAIEERLAKVDPKNRWS